MSEIEEGEQFSVIIIGAGSGGLTAADFAAKIGAKVALIEAKKLGGDCTWTGCVPSKALLKASKVVHSVRKSPDYGVEGFELDRIKVNMQVVHDRIHSIIHQIYEEETPEVFESRGVRVFQGVASFEDEHHILVTREDGSKVRLFGARFVICTGARPNIPKFVKESGVPFYTYEDIFDVTELPESLLVVGSGPIGCEIGQSYARFGSKVTIVARHIMAKEEPEAQETMKKVFEKEGIVHLPHRMKSVKTTEDGMIEATLEDGTVVVAQKMLVASGRVPVVSNLNLEAANVEYDPQGGIKTNDILRTSVKHIYGAGDCIGSEQFTHYAGFQAFMAVRNFILPSHDKGKTTLVPRCTFTDPEVASVGMSEKEFREKYPEGKGHVAYWPAAKIDRLITDGETEGYYKIFYSSDKKIRGAVFVCSRAGELINEIAVCIHHGIKFTELGRVIHNYPSFGFALQQMGSEVAIEGLFHGITGKLIALLKKV
eukprot:m.26552 g.26552  ORF g.26552 m.26552 type:complete len:484 (+) comp5866_c0_seq1:60-1511(+)